MDCLYAKCTIYIRCVPCIGKPQSNLATQAPRQGSNQRSQRALRNTLHPQLICICSDCVMAELEKLGSKYKVALRIARDARFERLPCQHKGT
jgi:hypothetical protein